MNTNCRLFSSLHELSLKTNYEQYPVFAHNVNQIFALAFLDLNDVSQGFDDLYNALAQVLHPLLDYFEDTYVGRRHLQGRSRPIFEIDFWNMHQRTTDLLIRTNNSVEGWHRRLSSITQYEQPNLWKFIECLQNEEDFIHCQLIKINSGEKVPMSPFFLTAASQLRAVTIVWHNYA